MPKPFLWIFSIIILLAISCQTEESLVPRAAINNTAITAEQNPAPTSSPSAPLLPLTTPTSSMPTPSPVPIFDQEVSGKLVLIDVRPYPNHRIIQHDLMAQQASSLFDVPENGWVHQINISEEQTTMAIAYSAPPMDETQPPFDRSGIFIASLGENGLQSEPELLVGNAAPSEFFFDPVWANGDQTLFYVRYILSDPNDSSSSGPDVALFRYDLETERSTLIAQDGIWPRVSPDGEQLVYIQVDPGTLRRSIIVSDLDGKNGQVLISEEAFFDLDTPHFSEDGASIYFTAVPHSTSSQRAWWEVMLGVQIAEAHTSHNIPSDWWRISVDGGTPEKVTSFLRIISHGSFDHSGKHLFFAANAAIFSVSDLAGEVMVHQVPVNTPSRYVFYIK
ncbi:MAG: hypothetical protein AAF633_20050 [Chloroflexota bacterium]